MNLVKTLLATTFALTAATATFAASEKTTQPAENTEKVIVSTQEQPSDATQADETAAGTSNANQPSSESAVEAPATPAPKARQ